MLLDMLKTALFESLSARAEKYFINSSGYSINKYALFTTVGPCVPIRANATLDPPLVKGC